MHIGFTDPFVSYMAVFIFLGGVMAVMGKTPNWGFALIATTILSLLAYRVEVSPIVCGALPLGMLALVPITRAWIRYRAAPSRQLSQR